MSCGFTSIVFSIVHMSFGFSIIRFSHAPNACIILMLSTVCVLCGFTVIGLGIP